MEGLVPSEALVGSARILPLLPLLPFAAALAALLLAPLRYSGIALALVPASLFGWLVLNRPDVPVQVALPWIPDLGLSLAFRLDGLSWLYALLITGIGALVVLYSDGYMAHEEHRARFFAILLSFMGSMLGLVLADDLILLFVFWELTSVTSYLLIGFKNENAEARTAAKHGLVVTAGAGFAMLAGLVLLQQVTGQTQLSAMLDRGGEVVNSPFYVSILVLVCLGCFAKSAQWPFHFWLPEAMRAPTPVSAYLHSATMVQAGVYLLAKLNPVLGGTPQWTGTLSIVGGITVIVGSVLLLFSRDLKKILAYSTIAALGLLTFLVGQNMTQGFAALVLAHALYKAGMFLTAGSIEHEAGSRDAPSLGGLAESMPLTFVGGLACALSMAGILPFLGFVAKEVLLYEAQPVAAAVLVLYGAGSVVAAYAVGVKPFLGKRDAKAHDAPVQMLVGPFVVGIAGLGIGLSGLHLGPLFNWSLMEGDWLAEAQYAWKWLPAVGVPLMLSVMSLGLGGGLAALWQRDTHRGLLVSIDFNQGLSKVLEASQWISTSVTGVLQHGRLPQYLRLMVASTVGLVVLGFAETGVIWRPVPAMSLAFYEVAIGIAISVGALSAVVTSSRLAAVASLGIVGFCVALIYVLYGAPDLAMTQAAVETLTLILFVFAFSNMPRVNRPPVRVVRGQDTLLAVSIGIAMAGLSLIASSMRPAQSISSFYTERSVPEAHGRNIVNVILVDFRALDTLGEITVMGAAAAGVYALLKMRICYEPKSEDSP